MQEETGRKDGRVFISTEMTSEASQASGEESGGRGCPFTCVGVEADGGVEALAVLQDVQREQHLGALALLLNAVQRALQVQPEADFLQGGSRGRVSVEFGHL